MLRPDNTDEAGNITPAQRPNINPNPPNLAGYAGLVPCFSADTDSLPIKQFFGILEEISDLAQWQARERLLIAKSKMRAEAANYLRTIAYSPDVREYERFKRNLIERFTTDEPLSTRMQRMLACKQMSGEKVKSYATRLEARVYQTWSDEENQDENTLEWRDQTLMSLFIAGLIPRIKRLVLSHNPDNYNDAKRKAILEEINELSVSAGRTLHAFESGTALADTHVNTHTQEMVSLLADMKRKMEGHEKECKKSFDSLNEQMRRLSVTRMMENERETRVRPREHQRRDAMCFYCRKWGHYAEDCFLRNRNRGPYRPRRPNEQVAHQSPRNDNGRKERFSPNTVPKRTMGNADTRNPAQENEALN